MSRPILVVDDNHDLARGVGLLLGELSDDVTVVHSGREALEAFARHPADLVVSDVRMPGLGGMGLLHELHERAPRTRVVLLTGYGTIEAAVAAMKRGAFDYLTKPFEDQDLLDVARRALEEAEREDAAELVRRQLGASGRSGIYTRDPLQRYLRDAIAMSQHFSFNFDIAGSAFGLHALGGGYANPAM